MSTGDSDALDDGFLDSLAERFTGFGSSTAKAHERAERERVARLSPAQRKLRGPATKQVNFRATDRTRVQIARLAKTLGKANTEIIAEAIDLLAKTHGCDKEGTS